MSLLFTQSKDTVFISYTRLFSQLSIIFILKAEHRVIISQTSTLADVLFSLPLANVLKHHRPDCYVFFIGRAEVRPIVESCHWVDIFMERSEVIDDKRKWETMRASTIIHVSPDYDLALLAWQVGIKNRIGINTCWFHWFTCNKRTAINSDKKKHKAQLYLDLARPLRANTYFSAEVTGQMSGLKYNAENPLKNHVFTRDKFSLIVQVKNVDGTKEWPLDNYLNLFQLLSSEQFTVFMIGTTADEKFIQANCPDLLQLSHVQNLLGNLSLEETAALISKADGFLSCYTDFLHLAAALERFVLGLYALSGRYNASSRRPLGLKASFLSIKKKCSGCTTSDKTCACIEQIEVENVAKRIHEWQFIKTNNNDTKPFFT